jgi:hypothetical protein
MGFPTENRTNVAGQILAFAAPRRKNGGERDVTSLTSKALWCCFPEDVPIFDNNAVSALRFLSRLYRWTPGANQSEYARFVNLWFLAYDESESRQGRRDRRGYPIHHHCSDSGNPATFGPSRAGVPSPTQTLLQRGTAEYASPEQVMGKPFTLPACICLS